MTMDFIFSSVSTKDVPTLPRNTYVTGTLNDIKSKTTIILKLNII